MTTLVVLTVIVIALLIAGLAFFLYWTGTLLTRIAGNLEGASGTVDEIVGHARLIGPGVEHINRTGGVVAGALPLLYGMAEEIVAGVTYVPAAAGAAAAGGRAAAGAAAGGEPAAVPEPARPASGRRRSRLHEAVGFAPRP